MDGASKVKCAEQVTTNICAIFNFFFNCEFCHELARTVYIIQWEASQNKHQPTVEKYSLERLVTKLSFFKKGGFWMHRSRNPAVKSAGKWISRFKANWPQCDLYQAS